MVKANKKSLDAKAYINGKVNDMREKFYKASDEQARKQLVETFRETTSSDEYKENLEVVHEDTDVIRTYAKRKKGGDITSEEFKDAKTEFYGKDMSLEFGEDFEKLSLGKKVDYIFERFGDTDYAADLIIHILSMLRLENNKDEIKLKKRLLLDIIRKGDYYYGLEGGVDDIFNKFGAGQVGLRLATFFADNFHGTGYDVHMYKRIFDGVVAAYYRNTTFGGFNHKRDITENTLKYLLRCSDGARNIIRYVILGCKDYSVSDHDILDFLVINNMREGCRPLKKLTSEGQKYYIEKFLEYYKTTENNRYYEAPTYLNSLFNDMNLGEGVEPLEFIINYTFKIFDDVELGKLLCGNNFQGMREYHKQIVDLFIKAGKIDIVKNFINKFTGLSDMEKAKIMGDAELEDKLNREKFDVDLAKLQELGAKLGKEIVIKDIKGGIHDEKQEVLDHSEKGEQNDKQESYSNGRKRFTRR